MSDFREQVPARPCGQARWYGSRVIWLGALIFVALVSGCIATIVVATRYPDDVLPSGEQVLKVPLARSGKIATDAPDQGR